MPDGEQTKDRTLDELAATERSSGLVETLQATTSPPGLVAEKVEHFLRRFVVMTEAQATVLALWVLHTFAIEAAETTPYLAVTSAEKQSGKTRLLEVLELVVARPLRAAGATEAALFRSLADEPTLLFDEVDAIFGPKAQRENESLRALLNSGFRRGSPILRVVGDGKDMRVEPFPVFGPKVLAGIGELPDTIADRSLPTRLKRRTPDEKVERFRHRDASRQAAPIREELERWSGVNVLALADARPLLPEELDDRAQDVIEPLLAIADLLGGDWPERARHAAIEVKTVDEPEESIGVRLLRDAHACFADKDELTTTELLVALFAIEEAPWEAWWSDLRAEEPTPNRGATMKLARKLKPYGIHSHDLWTAGRSLKGYRKADFEDAFLRYTPEKVARSREAHNHAENSDLRSQGTSDLLATSNGRFSAKESHSRDLATSEQGEGAVETCLTCGETFDSHLKGTDLFSCGECVRKRLGLPVAS